MVTDEKPQILNCNILFYFKSIEQTITFELCFISQFKCNGLHDSLFFIIICFIDDSFFRIALCADPYILRRFLHFSANILRICRPISTKFSRILQNRGC